MPLTTSAQFSFVLRVRIDHRPGMLGRVATAIGEAGGTIGSIDLIAIDDVHTLRDMALDAAGTDPGSIGYAPGDTQELGTVRP